MSSGGHYRGAPAEDCEHLLERLCEWLNGDTFDVSDEDERCFPWALMKAVVAHLYLAWIHPFGDGNGRTAQSTSNYKSSSRPACRSRQPIFPDHYNVTRSDYYRQLARASESGDPVPFVVYAMRGFVDGIAARMHVRNQQWTSVWEQYIDETFDGASGPAARRRQRNLVRAMTTTSGTLSRNDLATLTQALWAEYAGTEKKLPRDLNALTNMGLIERVPGGWRDRRHVILAFLPLRTGDLTDVFPPVILAPAVDVSDQQLSLIG